MMSKVSKIISIACVVTLAAIITAGCGSGAEKGSTGIEDNKDSIQIVTTIFPEYDWVMNILGDNPSGAEVTMLLSGGVDMHSYQPTADDILKISTCDLFIYVGGESDEWVSDALKEATNKDMTVINLMDVLGERIKEEELIQGMQDEDEHDDEEDEHEHEHNAGEPEYDEHVWLSLKNAAEIVENISEAIQMTDPEHSDTYRSNTSEYISKLNALDAKYRETISGSSLHTLLFGDRFPFRYLTDDYGLDYYAAFPGCSAESEASFETIAFLSEKTEELSLPAVMTIEGSDHKIAETIVQNTKSRNQKILTLDSMQSVTSEEIQSGAAYLSAMEGNLSVLQEALN